MRRAAFLDKDGTLVHDVPYNVDPARIALVASAARALGLLQGHGYAPIVVSNQPGVAEGRFPASALAEVRRRIEELLAPHGVVLAAFHFCPHAPVEGAPACGCRKPRPGLLLQAAAEHAIDLAASWMIGDILDDVEAGRRAGCRSALIDCGNETEWKRSPWRVPDLVAPDLVTAARLITARAAARDREHAW